MKVPLPPFNMTQILELNGLDPALRRSKSTCRLIAQYLESHGYVKRPCRNRVTGKSTDNWTLATSAPELPPGLLDNPPEVIPSEDE